jgi:hypothetical protein
VVAMAGTAAATAFWTLLLKQWAWQAGPMWFNIFPDFPKPVQTCKFKIDALHCSKKFHILYYARFGWFAQHPKLCWLQTPNWNHVKNRGIDLIFEFSMNFKRVQTFWEISDKFSKILYCLDLQKNEFSWAHLSTRNWVTTQVRKGLVWIKEKSSNLKIKSYNIYNTNQTCKDFIQTSEIHS